MLIKNAYFKTIIAHRCYIVVLASAIICLILKSCSAAEDPSKVLFGKWTGVFMGKPVELIIYENDRSCRLEYYDLESGDFKVITGKFVIDNTKKPLPLTIEDIPQLNSKLHSIFEIINEDSIRIAEFSTAWRLRPVSFESGKTINLKRSSDNNF